MSCAVSNCRFPITHTTRSHMCGNCHTYGHGIIECPISHGPYHLSSLSKHWSDVLSLDQQCRFSGCRFFQYHTTEAHHCDTCKGRMHDSATCGLNIKRIVKCPLCRTINELGCDQRPVIVSDNCCVCDDKKAEVYFSTCGHICICSSCCFKMEGTKEGLELVEPKPEYLVMLEDYPSYFVIVQNMGCSTIVRRAYPGGKLESLFMHSDDWAYDKEKFDRFIKGYCDTKKSITIYE